MCFFSCNSVLLNPAPLCICAASGQFGLVCTHKKRGTDGANLVSDLTVFSLEDLSELIKVLGWRQRLHSVSYGELLNLPC